MVAKHVITTRYEGALNALDVAIEFNLEQGNNNEVLKLKSVRATMQEKEYQRRLHDYKVQV